MPTDNLKAWARVGASLRLNQLNEERAAILSAFPDLRDGQPPTGTRRRGRPPKVRRTMSVEARAKIAAAQRRRWKKYRAAAKKR